ncbi:MAG: endonuclease domain-containing protein [Gallionella sp.]|nr:endonuclease domain-containing protein [Gallionella sp.]
MPRHDSSPELGQAGNPHSGCSQKGRLGGPISRSSNSSSPDKGRLGGVACFIPYDKRLTALARENRKNPTGPESRMWNEILRMRHFSDFKFLRQKPIDRYIVDFYCAKLRVAIEIDGDSHAESVNDDLTRTAILNAQGVSVLRYTNSEVMQNIEGVYEDLLSKIILINDRNNAQ